MRKRIVFLICSMMITSFFLYPNNKNNIKGQQDISEKIIRFHCVANSDSSGDQNVKLKVRDAVLNDVGNKLTDVKNRDESLKIIEENLPKIEKTANDILLSEGKAYRAKVYLGRFNFPVKNYSDITLPEGKYTALRVVLGNGDGKNWWCVMFPPLCFIDITKGLTNEETDMRLGEVLSLNEVNSITQKENEAQKIKSASLRKSEDSSHKDLNKVINKNTNKKLTVKESLEPSVEFRFKTIDTIKSVYNKFKIIMAKNL